MHASRRRVWVSSAPAALVALALALMGLVLVACGQAAPRAGAPRATARPAASASAPAPTWDVRKLVGLEPAGPRGPSEHHAGSVDAEVLTTAGAAPYPRTGPAYAPTLGALLVERLYAPDATELLGTLVMERVAVDGGQTWRFVELDAAGRVVRSELDGDCARCHAEAPNGNGVFGLPVPSKGGVSPNDPKARP